jgi:peroxiredoxin
MSKVALNAPAPDFALADFSGAMVRLSDFRGKKTVVLVFNRGFT